VLSENLVVEWITSTLGITWGDATVIQINSHKRIAVNVDAFDGELHWPSFLDAYSAGLRAYRGSTSDIIVRGAKPLAVLVALRVPRNFPFETLKDFVKGISDAAQEFDAVYLGGDTDIVETDSFRAEVVSIGALHGEPLTRGGARPGDLVVAVGDFGVSSLLYDAIQGNTPPLPLREVIRTWLKPKWPPVNKWLENTAYVTASIDNSDGLALSLHYLSENSNVRIELDEIPIYPPLLEHYTEKEALERALYLSGEEYNFIFTIHPKHEALLDELNARILGRVTTGSGVFLKGYGPIQKSGWISGLGYARGSR